MVLSSLHCYCLLLFPHWFAPSLHPALHHFLADLQILNPVICRGRTPQWYQCWHVTSFFLNFSSCLLQHLPLLAGLPPIMAPYPLSPPVDCCSLNFFFCHLQRPLSLLATAHVINADATLAPLLHSIADAAAPSILPLLNLVLYVFCCSHCHCSLWCNTTVLSYWCHLH